MTHWLARFAFTLGAIVLVGFICFAAMFVLSLAWQFIVGW